MILLKIQTFDLGKYHIIKVHRLIIIQLLYNSGIGKHEASKKFKRHKKVFKQMKIDNKLYYVFFNGLTHNDIFNNNNNRMGSQYYTNMRLLKTKLSLTSERG